MKEFLRAVKFTIFSLSAGIIEYTSFSLLIKLKAFSYFVSEKNYFIPCYIVALILSILWNFTLNRRFTFKSAANIPIAMLKVLAYYAVFTPLSTWLGYYLADVILWDGYLVTAINMILNFITEFLYQRFFVFGKSIDTNEKADRF